MTKLNRIYPRTWKSGPDSELHELHYMLLRWRVKKRRRREQVSITLEDWFELWCPGGDKTQLRRRKEDNLVIIRVDEAGPWAVHNMRIVPRGHFNSLKWKKIKAREKRDGIDRRHSEEHRAKIGASVSAVRRGLKPKKAEAK